MSGWELLMLCGSSYVKIMGLDKKDLTKNKNRDLLGWIDYG
jgi:hypothetical protein